MSGATFLAIFTVLPAVVLFAGVAFAIWDQERRAIYIVRLNAGVALEDVLDGHRERFGIDVQQSWAGDGLPGYRANVRRRAVKGLVSDSDVASVELVED